MAKNIDDVLFMNSTGIEKRPKDFSLIISEADLTTLKQSLYSDILELIERCFENNDGYIDDKLRQALKEYFNL